MDIRRKTDGEPPTNQIKSGKLPQNRTDNMVSNKKQKGIEKESEAAKAKAAAAKAAEEREIEGTRNQDIPDETQGEITTSAVWVQNVRRSKKTSKTKVLRPR